MDRLLTQILLLLGTTVIVVVAFQRLRIPSSLGYLLVGAILGPHTAGPVVEDQPVRIFAEFGIVFLLFSIGLSFPLSRIHALGRQVLSLGTGQVVLTAAAVGVLAWVAGLSVEVAFVLGAVFAQSSTTVITKQLTEQREDGSRHGRLATAISVFQDVTSVPFVVVIPVLTAAAGAGAVTGSLAWAMAKAALAVAAVFLAGRWLLRPIFHLVAEQRSLELFTLAVLFVSLAAAWATSSLGLSMAFGAFLVGMMLGETEFRHQVEAAIRPFRDVLIGLFFVGIGMLFDPGSVVRIWHVALLGAVVLLVVKSIVVTGLAYVSGVGLMTAWRTGLILSVGGEFGFALLAIALGADAVDASIGQVALFSVLFSMVAAPLLIRYNHPIARLLTPRSKQAEEELLPMATMAARDLHDHVIICGYGRIGQSVGHFLEESEIPYVALDLDPRKVRQAHLAGEPVFYGDAAQTGILEAVGANSARLIVISHPDTESAFATLRHARNLAPALPIMVRTRDESRVDELLQAGATEVVPETVEASLMIASQALMLLGVPVLEVTRMMQEQRENRHQLVHELLPAEDTVLLDTPEPEGDRLLPVRLPPDSPAIGRRLGEIPLEGVAVTALVRKGKRQLMPPAKAVLEADDALVLFGSPDDLQRAARFLRGT